MYWMGERGWRVTGYFCSTECLLVFVCVLIFFFFFFLNFNSVFKQVDILHTPCVHTNVKLIYEDYAMVYKSKTKSNTHKNRPPPPPKKKKRKKKEEECKGKNV